MDVFFSFRFFYHDKDHMNGIGIQVDLDRLCRVIFIENTADKFVALAADLRDIRDCFCFCLDLLCNGLVLLYGKSEASGKKKVDLDTLSIEQLDFVKNRLALCGIKAHYHVVPVSMYDDAGISYPKTQKIELPNLEKQPLTDPLDAYKVDIFTQGLHIQLHFELIIPTEVTGFSHGCH